MPSRSYYHGCPLRRKACAGCNKMIHKDLVFCIPCFKKDHPNYSRDWRADHTVPGVAQYYDINGYYVPPHRRET